MSGRNRLLSGAGLLLWAGVLLGIAASAEESAPTTEPPAAPSTESATTDALPAAPADAPAPPPEISGPQYTDKGADTCLKCHDQESDAELPVYPIFKTKHGVRADPRTPFAGLQCEACHGPGIEATPDMKALSQSGHAKKIRPGEKRPPILNFGPESSAPAAIQNRMCLDCHEGKDRIGWHGSEHEASNVVCASCHKIHAEKDPVLTKAAQAEVCLGCHKKNRADFLKPSYHPVRSGKLACSDCHKPHGSNTPALMARPNVNQTCHTCHAEKRGPFLWEHAPVAEDCTLCHTPHGSVHTAMLKKSLPLLCQQCHQAAGHPAVARDATALPGGSSGPSGFLLAGSCTNCHSQVHGSNHPSGVKLMR